MIQNALLRMAVSHTDSDYSSKEIQVSVALVVEQVLHVALVEKQRLAVKERGSRSKLILSDAPHCVVWDVLERMTCRYSSLGSHSFSGHPFYSQTFNIMSD